MKQLLILSTIFLLFIFTNQLLAQPLNNTKKPFPGKIKDGRPLTRFKPVNYTFCLYGKKLSCFKSKYSNKTYCICIKNNSSRIRNYHDLIPKCRLGTVRKCRYNFKTRSQNCYCETIPQILKPVFPQLRRIHYCLYGHCLPRRCRRTDQFPAQYAGNGIYIKKRRRPLPDFRPAPRPRILAERLRA